MAKKKFDNDGNEVDAVTDEATETPAPPDPWVVLARLTSAMEVIAANSASGGNTGRNDELMVTLTSALERLAAAQITGSELVAQEHRRAAQAVRPSNQIIPEVSVFNRRGTKLEDYQKPKLKCLMMLPWLVEWESVTREEVELLNLLEAGSYVITRIDRTKITATVTIDYKTDGKTPSRLIMTHDTAFNNDNFKMMPPLTDMLRGILKQHDRSIANASKAVLSDEEEEALIEAGQLSVSA